MSSKKINSTPSSSSLDEGSTSQDVDTQSSTSESEIDFEDAGYKRLLDDFPVGLWVWKYDENANDIRLAYANAVSDPFVG